MRALLASPLGFLIGVSLGALGGGGSILAVPALVYAAGQSPRDAVTTSLLIVGAASAVGMIKHWRAGRVRVVTGVLFGLAGIPGSLVGSALNRRMNGDVLLLLFSALTVVAAWRMLTGCPSCTRAGDERAVADAAGSPDAPASLRLGGWRLTVVALVGVLIGFMTGLFGVGGGFIIVPALTLVLRMPIAQAIGTSLLVIVINTATSFSQRIADTTIDWGVTAPFTIAAIAGVLVGGTIADRLPAERSLRWFAGLLVAVAVYVAIRASIALA